MNTLLQPLLDLTEYETAKECLLAKDTPVLLSGCIDSQKAHIMAGLGADYKNRVIVTYNELKAKEIYEDLRLYSKDVYLYPAKDVMFFSADVHGSAIVAKRLEVIKHILSGEPVTVVLSVEAAMDKILPLSYVKESIVSLTAGGQLDVDLLKKQLVTLGYERVEEVMAKGQFAIRGGIIDIFPLSDEAPVRIELWDDEIDTIRTFDVESQRSIEKTDSINIYPASEFILGSERKAKGIAKINKERDERVKALRLEMLTEEAARLKHITEEFEENLDIYGGSFGIDSYISYFYKDTVSFVDYFGDDTVFFLDEPGRLEEKGEMIETEFAGSMTNRLEKGYILPGQMGVLFSHKTLLRDTAKKNTCMICTIEARCSFAVPVRRLDLTVKSVGSYNSDFELLVKDIARYKKQGYRTVIACGSRTRAEHVADDLRENEISAVFSSDPDRVLQPGEVVTIYGSLHKGFEYPLIKTV
ncbi:MAG: transcription-repair coupling factor, partial [Lachnospiraceae bacterium]|nr:transcription-repair coupling factor [Lachnospiraceae bacterium]